MKIGQEWQDPIGEVVTVTNVTETDVTYLDNDKLMEYTYNLEFFYKEFQVYLAKGQIWTLPSPLDSTKVLEIQEVSPTFVKFKKPEGVTGSITKNLLLKIGTRIR